ncbi:transcriptional regulator [Agaricicola taiwanensis]|uniref:Transcriptional regulator n=1 Tax=Agaricicola taiwanensis TaxID=591372 RepID=A0A8J2VMN3_9RHOB|nr:LysR substrate-binding domain-containing protein [Agaricicola taiwanensis]GGE30891.1 transcriptional regulator [Agaricicola taiwanensis]
MPQLPPLNAIRAFEAAARLQSFKHAAEELRVTDSAISRHIALLEAWLRVKLFRRLTRQVVLTAEGAALFSETSPALSRIAAAAESISRVNDAETRIAVSASPTFTMRWLIPRLPDFLRSNPGIDISLTTSIEPADFMSGYDMAIRRVSQVSPDLGYVRILDELRIPVCHPSLKERINPEDPTTFLSQELLHARTSLGAWAEWLAEVGVTEGLPPQTTFFDEMYFVVQAAASGLGFGIVPAPLVIDEVLSGKLALPYPYASRRANHYHAIFPKTRRRNRAIASFCDWMAEQGQVSARLVCHALDLDPSSHDS